MKRGDPMRYMVGDIVEGTITGIQPYGAFVSLDSDHKGLIHISEISDYFVKDVHYYVKLHDRIKVKVLDVDEEHAHLKLSLKAVSANKTRFRKKTRIQTLPPMDIGFASIEEKLDQWIADAADKENEL